MTIELVGTSVESQMATMRGGVHEQITYLQAKYFLFMKQRIIINTNLLVQLFPEGPKYMQMGGLILKMERMAEGIVHIPSPHIKPEATAPA